MWLELLKLIGGYLFARALDKAEQSTLQGSGGPDGGGGGGGFHDGHNGGF